MSVWIVITKKGFVIENLLKMVRIREERGERMKMTEEK